MFFNDPVDDDEDDFTPTTTTSSKLSSLFGGGSDKSSSLKYVAPKQPRPDSGDSSRAKSGSPAPSAQQSTAVMIAAPVHAYLYVNGAAQSQGQVMCCIVGNCTQKNFQLLIYRSRQDHLTRARIHQHFSFTVQPNNYGSFTDDQQRNWSIMLEAGHYVDFITQVGICRAIVSGSGSSNDLPQVTQDVTVGEGPSLREGDQTQVTVSTWSVVSGKRSHQTDETKTSHRIKVIGGTGSWEGRLTGAQKSTRRLIFTSQSKDDGGLLMYDVTVERVKQKGDHSGRNTPQRDIQQVQKEENSIGSKTLELLPEDPDVQAKDDTSHATKAALVSRMARVGHPLLPSRLSNSRSVATDSESEVEEISRRQNKRHNNGSMSGSTEELEATSAIRSRASSTRSDSMRPEPAPRPAHLSPHPQQLVVYQSSPWQQPGLVAPGYSPMQAPIPVTPQVAPPPQAPAASDSMLSLLFSEGRSQNTKLEISLSKISDKIDSLTSKIEKLEQQPHQVVGPTRTMPYYQDPSFHGTAVSDDPNSLLVHITKIVSENKEMKSRLEDKEKTIVSLNSSVTQLFQENQKLLEEKIGMLEAKQQQVQELPSLQEKATIAENQLASLQEELHQSKKSVMSQQSEIQSLKSQIQAEQTRRQQDSSHQEQLVKAKETLEEKVQTLQTEKDSMNSLLRTAEEQKQTLQQELSAMTSEKTVVEEQLRHAQSEAERLKGQAEAADVRCKSLMQQMEEEKAQRNKESSGEEQSQRQQQEVLQAQASKIKQLQSRCSELEEQKAKNSHKHEVQLQKVISEKTLLEETVQQLKTKTSSQSAPSGSSPEEVVDTVKKVMNTVFRTLKPQFVNEKTYSGSEVLQTMLGVFRDTTLQLMEDLERRKSTVSNSTASQNRIDNETVRTSVTEEKAEENNQENVSRISDQLKTHNVDVIKNSMVQEDSERLKSKEEQSGNDSGENMVCKDGVPVEGTVGDDSFSDAERRQSTDPSLAESSQPMLVSNCDSSNINDHEELNPPNSLGREQKDDEAQEVVQVKENEEEPLKSTNDRNTEQKIPVIDMENTEVRTKTPEKTNSSRDSSLERDWRPRPPSPALFSDEDEDDDDWLS